MCYLTSLTLCGLTLTMQPGHSLRTFVGHSDPVTSLDFHPNKGDLICSSDYINEIRYWSIKNDGCARVLKVQVVEYFSGIHKSVVLIFWN